MKYLPKSAIQALNPPDLNIINWVENNRFLSKNSSAITGLKKISRTPYIKRLYEFFIDDTIKTIVVQKPAQIGLTDWVVDCILWIAVNDPSPTGFFLADQETAKKIMRLRLEPAFKQLGLTKRKKAANKQQDVNKFEIQLTNGFYLAVGWGSSISQTASTSFKRVFCDEINKPGYTMMKDEGDTLDRIEERLETFGDSKFVLLSTPTLDDGQITKRLNSADVIFDFCVPCPFCGTFQPMTFTNIVWKGGNTASKEDVEDSVRFKCSSCNGLMTELQRQDAVGLGELLPRTDKQRYGVVGVQLHRLNSLFKGGNMATIVSRFLEARNDLEKLQNIVNSTFGEPWVPRISSGQDDVQGKVARCRSPHRKGELPPDVVAIVAGIDVQMSGFWYRVRAITSDNSSYAIDGGYLQTIEEVDEIILNKLYDGRKVWRCLIDIGGTKSQESAISKTEETYNWIRSTHGSGVQVFGSKGSSHSMSTKIKIGSPIERTPSGKPIPGGLRIIQLNTDLLKDTLFYKIERTAESPEQPGGWWLYDDVPDWEIEQITAEEKRRERGGGTKWHVVRRDNHLLDCEVMCLAAADNEFWGGVALERKRQVKAKVIKPMASKPRQERRPNPYLEN